MPMIVTHESSCQSVCCVCTHVLGSFGAHVEVDHDGDGLKGQEELTLWTDTKMFICSSFFCTAKKFESFNTMITFVRQHSNLFIIKKFCGCFLSIARITFTFVKCYFLDVRVSVCVPPTCSKACPLSYLLFAHLGELEQEGKVLGQVFAVRLHAVLHDGQQRLDKARHAGAAADVLHRSVHVIRTAGQRR